MAPSLPGQARQRNAIWNDMDGTMWGDMLLSYLPENGHSASANRRARYGSDCVIKMTGPAASADRSEHRPKPIFRYLTSTKLIV